MRKHPLTPVRGMALVAGVSVLATMTTLPAAAATDGDVEVVNTETVKIYTDATGEVESKRLYEQLALTGDGAVDITNPVVADGLRNLDGFGGFDVEDGEQVVNVEVDGEENLRSVSDYDGDMPLDVTASYTLDGEELDPEDVVGKSGELTVTYKVENITQESQLISFPDGKGGTMSREVEVMMPMVGSLTTTLPNNFRNPESDANMAGDGEGGTKLSFTMTLLAPIGSDTAELSYTADVKDAVVPDASITALPVNPLEVPSFKSAGSSYQSGAATGAELANGAATIDSNLLKLRDGASKLLAGMIQLRDGAGELNKGLADTAVPGAMKLSAGAGELDDGLGQLDEGAGKLAAGSEDAYDGSQDLTSGLGKISAGLDKLAGVEGLPKARKGAIKLKNGVDAIIATGLGDPGQVETLIGGLTSLNQGLGLLEDGSGRLVQGIQLVIGGLDLLKSTIIAKGPDTKAAITGLLTPLGQQAGALAQNPDCTGTCPAAAMKLLAGIQGLGPELEKLLGGSTAAILGGIQQIRDGITVSTSEKPGLLDGAMTLQTKLGEAEVGSAKLLTGAQTVKGYLADVSGGLEDLTIGLTGAVDGVFQLSSGAQDAYAGSGELSAGLGQISGGAGQLADGTGAARDGSGRIADGAGQLADGLGDAADGSGLLFDGLVSAALGVPKLRDGAQELSDKGTSKLVDAGLSTAQEYGLMYATLEAGGERADNSKMVAGAPEDAIGLAAYSYEIKGEDGEGGRNLTRGLAGLALLGAGGAAFALRRRFI